MLTLTDALIIISVHFAIDDDHICLRPKPFVTTPKHAHTAHCMTQQLNTADSLTHFPTPKCPVCSTLMLLGKGYEPVGLQSS